VFGKEKLKGKIHQVYPLQTPDQKKDSIVFIFAEFSGD
jgi:hypothetical protein